MQTQEFNDVVERFIYAHQQSQLPLRGALTHAKMRTNEAEAQRKQEEEAQHVALNTLFPQTIEAYDKITNRTHKLRVSRLLVAPTTEEKEQIASSYPGFNWGEEDCTALMGAFGSDVCARFLACSLATCILIWAMRPLDITASIRREGARIHREFTKHGPKETTYRLGLRVVIIQVVRVVE